MNLFLCGALALGVVQAQEPEISGRLVFRASPEAQVELLPQVHPTRVEILVRENQAPLDEQLEGKLTPWVSDMAAWSMGGGTWLMVLDLERPDVRPRVEQTVPRWTLHLEPGYVPSVEVPETVPLEELLSGDRVRQPASRGGSSLHPLDGDVAQGRLDASTFSPSYPIWQPPVGKAAEVALLAEPRGDLFVAIDRYRHVLTATGAPRYEAQALYQLGRAHLAAGLAREAHHYFGRLDELEGHWPPIHGRLAQAWGALAAGEPEVALGRCRQAAAIGARQVHVLECLGSVALVSGDPPPSEVGRALAARSGRAESLLLAAQLLQQDHRHSEARVLLAGVVPVLDGELGRVARLTLGDSLFALGDADGARRAWQSVGTSGELGLLTRERLRLKSMVEKGPGEWPGFLPDLYRAAREPGPAAAEALYAAAQVSEALGDLEGAADHLAELLDRYGHQLQRSDVPARLWALSERRMEQLSRSGRDLELAAFYREHYRPVLRHEVRGTAVLGAVAEAFEGLGLYTDALDVSREVFAIHTRQDRDEPAALVRLARLYARSSRYTEALETLRYTRRLRSSGPWRGQMLLLEGEVLLELDRTTEASRSWREAAGFADVKQEALSRLALLDADQGRCDRAITALQGLVSLPRSETPEAVQDGRAHLALARCLLGAGEREQALVAARDAAGRSDDQLHKRYATYLAALAADSEGLTGDALASDDDLWAALGREAQQDAAFKEEVERYKQR